MFPGLTFGSPWSLWGLLALPVLAGLFLWAERQAGVRLARLIQTPRLRAQLTGAASAARRRARYGVFLLALAALVTAWAGPRLGYETRETHRRGLDLIVVVDVSKSMLATDLTPTRLARARLATQDFVTQLEGDRIGIVAFAGTAFLQAPMTVDYEAVLNTVNELDTEIIPRGGTNLGAALDLAVDAFGKAEAGNRAILLLSDGEPTSVDDQAQGVQAAKRAADVGVKIFTLGFGTPEGSLIPLGDGNFVRDGDGQIVRTKLDENTLRAIATAGNGFYVRFNGDAAIRTVVQQGLSQLKAGEVNVGQARRPVERYQWPLGIGLALLTAAAFLSERRQARAPLSPAPRAVPSGRRTATAAAATVGALACMSMSGLAAVHAEDMSAAVPTGESALDLYYHGKYDDAYKAFEALAEKNPEQGTLQFNAGASAYMGKQYTEALNAFGKAMTSDDADLQTKANYNFGNTLFRRGDENKAQDQKTADWKNAIQHYEAALKAEEQRNPKASSKLSQDLKFNKELVEKKLKELPKEPPQQGGKSKDRKPDDKQAGQNQDQSGTQDQQPRDQSKKDGNQPPPNPSQQGQDQQGDDKQLGQSGQPQPDGGGKSSDEKNEVEGNQPPKPPPGEGGKPPGEKKDASGDGPRQENSPDPSQGKLRERGDFQAKPGENGGQPAPVPGQKSDGEPPDNEAGKMNGAQARALLDSLKGEDAHVNLGDSKPKHGGDSRRHNDDEPPLKDW